MSASCFSISSTENSTNMGGYLHASSEKLMPLNASFSAINRLLKACKWEEEQNRP